MIPPSTNRGYCGSITVKLWSPDSSRNMTFMPRDTPIFHCSATAFCAERFPKGVDAIPHVAKVREHRVILDSDLASLYEVPTKRLNEEFRRNIDRFPEDFAFQLT